MDGLTFAELAQLVSQAGLVPLVLYFIWQSNTERKQCHASMEKLRTDTHTEVRGILENQLRANTEMMGKVSNCLEDIKEKMK